MFANGFEGGRVPGVKESDHELVTETIGMGQNAAMMTVTSLTLIKGVKDKADSPAIEIFGDPRTEPLVAGGDGKGARL